MRTCVSCGDPIPDKKRKDAKYCDKAGCRGREYRKRQAEAQASDGKPHTHAASTVLACACGRRYKIQICALDETESRPEPAPAPPTTPPEAITGTVLPTDQQAAEPDAEPEVQRAANEAVTQAVLLTDPRPAEPPAATSAAAPDAQPVTQTDRTDTPATELVTLELNFTRGAERRMSFNKAAHHQQDGRWNLHPQARATFSLGDANRYCLGGRPGAWQRYYGGRSPVEYGYDPDLVVMVWDHDARRGLVADVNLLRQILGDDWKAKLRTKLSGT